MITIKRKWFECKVQLDRVMDNGLTKSVTEQYVVDAMSFAEAEAKIIYHCKDYTSGELEVKAITPAAYTEVGFMEGGEAILADETEKLCRALNVGKGQEQFDKPIDFNSAHVDAKWYKAKVAFITIDEKSNKEKRTNVMMLIEACSIHSACDNVDAMMKGSMIDYVSVSATETNILEVLAYEHKKQED